MSAPGPDFAKQKELASKKHSDLHDHEKMYLMRREIDHLRSVIRSQNDGSLESAKRESVNSSSTGSSSSSNSMDRAPVLTLFLFVGLIVVAIWKRRQRQRHSISGAILASRRLHRNEEEEVMTFELQDSLAAGYEAPPTSNSTFTIGAQQEEVEAQTIRI